MDMVEDEFRNLREAYSDEEVTKRLIDGMGPGVGFEEAWKKSALAERLPHLIQFCAGILTVFPSTATVEGDFSHINFCKDDYSSNLTDFSLESCLYAKQRFLIEKLARSFDDRYRVEVNPIGKGGAPNLRK